MTDHWILRLNAADAAIAWPAAGALIAASVAQMGGLYELEDVEHLVTQPESGTEAGWSLWLIGKDELLKGAWVTRVSRFPRCRVLETLFAGGKDMRSWWAFALLEMDKFAAAAGCLRLRCAGRRGWSRMGYRTIGYMHERKIA